MCSNKTAPLALAAALMAAAVVTAETPGTLAPRKPFAFTPGAAPAHDKVWSAVVLASNPARGVKPAEPPPELAPFAGKLAKFFGYSQFELLGAATKAMDGHDERWLVPTQNFWVGARAKREGAGYRINLEFFHDDRRLLATEAMLGPKSPLIIRGPVHARGQILMVFEVKP